MDIKLKNNKNGPKLLFIIMVISLVLVLLPFNIISMHDDDIYDGEFYESEIFKSYIVNLVNDMYKSLDEDNNQVDMESLDSYKNIKYMAVNNGTNKLNTNTDYDNIMDFKKKEKGYMQIEGKNYDYNIKINNKTDEASSIEKELELGKNEVKLESNEVNDVSIYAVLEEVPREKDQLRLHYLEYKDVNNIKKNISILAIIGMITFILSIVISKIKKYRYISEDSKIYKIYSKLGLELKLLFIIMPIVIDNIMNLYYFTSHYVGNMNIYYGTLKDIGSMEFSVKTIIFGFSIALKVIYITMIFMLIKNIKYGDIFKSSIIGKFIVNFNINIKNKNIFSVFISIIGINVAIYSFLNVFFGYYYDIRVVIMKMSMFISFIVCIAWIIPNSAQLLLLLVKRINIATKKIGLIKEIILIFIAIIVVNISIFGIMIVLFGVWIEHTAMVVVVIGAISFISFVAYIIVKLSYLNEIMEGVKKIESGDINYKIEVKGNDSFTVLAENINGIGNGLDNAIEERMKSEKMKSELITNVSHDLKTPLTSILNYVDLLKKEEVKPEYLNDYIAILDKKSKRLKILIEDLFEAAKATSGSVELNIEKIQLNQLLTQSIAEMEGKLKEAELDIKFNFPENKVYINADGKKLFRVFENLISNIVKYSLKGTRVYVDMNYDDEYAYVNFKNISAYELNFDEGEIIERFKRGDISRSEEGSGLGLSIAKGLVELQGGEFTIQTDGDLFKAIVKLKISKE